MPAYFDKFFWRLKFLVMVFWEYTIYHIWLSTAVWEEKEQKFCVFVFYSCKKHVLWAIWGDFAQKHNLYDTFLYAQTLLPLHSISYFTA